MKTKTEARTQAFEKEAIDLIDKEIAELESGKNTIISGGYYRVEKPMSKDELISLRKKLGVSQVQLADLMLVSFRTIQSYEQGINKIPGLFARALRLACTNKVFYTIFANNLYSEETTINLHPEVIPETVKDAKEQIKGESQMISKFMDFYRHISSSRRMRKAV
ncbi:MAG: hypothetical protein A2268_00120 [Candidatus Raymondbacteria bacterium RifOxyA12_full_50_37]|uniref:HTH cro/C1-type domain-containing protein n=1 Tax=Candidatus Raymondbacteria bacterium RIFOXYD12_FULL_49_13 TaxID=1817890 RepID=A0A1F7F2E9_UNCRA|nr:MAG: hypothetical protein A2268_00120 [Candidatus Raymondbacteria bacterium RifOxyA12_full_50_37]OGJ92725.1 MAG: hypothetical protein A2248_04170 [Candidatus Raymondbacteria bacterium RIFOXYA2_FULL_49_16]OGJ95924.1 MAG: hypothetical protein A2487_04505 [Candidatus Raymondbacteria bacterium RifOxyC12_full_50_8]OGK00743.1 MAG: hypothetical protein A2519_19950 [Candidatus Raymondbacteria bacterium RIFOXYD12_FULL_49_13]OGK04196.1 MAG: hypothetical protein A2350_02735 [Candidatus Raymondbacteria 